MRPAWPFIGAHGDIFLEIQQVHHAAPAAAAAFFRAGEAPALQHLAYVVDDPAGAEFRLLARDVPQAVTAATAGLSIAQYDLRPELGSRWRFILGRTSSPPCSR